MERKSISRYLIGVGDSELALILPQLMLLGFDLDRDEALIKSWCEAGTESGHQLAILTHAKLVYLGFLGNADRATAISIIEKHSSPDYLPAAYFRARLYFDLDATSIDYVDRSASQMQDLVEKNYPAAICTFAFSLIDSKSNYVDSEALLNKAASLGAPDALCWLANRYLDGDDKESSHKGIEFLKRAAESNYAAACARLSDIYRYGKYGAEVNYQKANFYEETYHRLSPVMDDSPDPAS